MTKKWFLISLVWIGMIIACILWGIFLSDSAEDDEALIPEKEKIAKEPKLLLKPLAPTTILFWDIKNDRELGRLDWGTGEFVFKGKADESARMFFDYYLKPMIDEYILSEMKIKER